MSVSCAELVPPTWLDQLARETKHVSVTKRSPQLRALENKYRRLRETEPPIVVTEPQLGGRSAAYWFSFSDEVAETYIPNQGFVTAPLT